MIIIISMYTTVIESLLRCTWVYIFLNWNKCVTRNERLPFSLIVRRGNVFSIWTGTRWIGSNCLWTLDTLKFDGSIRVQFGQLCEARAIEEYWHHLAFLASQWWPESSVSFDCQYVLQPPSAQGWQSQRFLVTTNFHLIPLLCIFMFLQNICVD